MSKCKTCWKEFYNPYINWNFCCIQCEQNYSINYKDTDKHLINLMKMFWIDK